MIESGVRHRQRPGAGPRYGVIAQTTQPSDKVARLVAMRCAPRAPEAEVRYCDTVCQPTKDRQSALHSLIARVGDDRRGRRAAEQQHTSIGPHGRSRRAELARQVEGAGELEARMVRRDRDGGADGGHLDAARNRGARYTRAWKRSRAGGNHCGEEVAGLAPVGAFGITSGRLAGKRGRSIRLGNGRPVDMTKPGAVNPTTIPAPACVAGGTSPPCSRAASWAVTRCTRRNTAACHRTDIALRNLPAAFDRTTIALLADTHHGSAQSR